MISVIISGAGGQLGKAFIERLSFKEDYSVFSFDRGQLDIADQEKIYRTLASLPQVKYWINCAAYTKVDAAEKNEKEATLYNALAPGYLSRACWEAGVHLFHFSSDYVYHNGLHRPLKEDDPTEPKSIYAKSKLEGEQQIIYSGVSYTILRTSWVYGPGGNNFVRTMLNQGKSMLRPAPSHPHAILRLPFALPRPPAQYGAAQQPDEVKVVGDQLGAPTFTYDIADAVKDLILLHQEDMQDKIRGVFNFANSGEVTWADFARTIFKGANIHCAVQTITTEDFGALAPRPSYSVLNCDKIADLLSDSIPHWEDALKRYLVLV